MSLDENGIHIQPESNTVVTTTRSYIEKIVSVGIWMIQAEEKHNDVAAHFSCNLSVRKGYLLASFSFSLIIITSLVKGTGGGYRSVYVLFIVYSMQKFLWSI